MSGSYMIMLGDTGLNITSQQVTLAAQSVIRINGAVCDNLSVVHFFIFHKNLLRLYYK